MDNIETTTNKMNEGALAAPTESAALAQISMEGRSLLGRMFANPTLLDKHERKELVNELAACVAAHPKVSDLRVLYGMALCVDIQVQTAMEELGEGVRLAPDSYIAQLKMGELWMRLRVCDKAADHTEKAARLAQNMAQAELARRQAATIRTMRREGIERGGNHKSPWTFVRKLVRLRPRPSKEASVALDLS